MPIKTQEMIHHFFDINAGKEFIRFGMHSSINFKFRYKYYFNMTNKLIGTNRKFRKITLALSVLGQQIDGINRAKKNSSIEFKKGTNWFSITDDLARYILEKQDWIEETFHSTYCCDEVFLQTIVHNSKFKNHLFHAEYDSSCFSNMRLIDWGRGRPYIFQSEDYEELINSPYLFARKFDENIDGQIIQRLYDYIAGGKKN